MIAARDCVTPALKRLLENQPLSPGKVSLAWSAAVGRTIDRVTSVALDDHGTLQVAAADRHWTREIARASRLIRAKMNELLGRDTVARLEVTTRR